MNFRGRSINNDIVKFSLKDCPILIYDDLIALKAIPNSDFIFRNSIARYSKSLDAWEFDQVFDSAGKYVGTLVYTNGFYIVKDDLLKCQVDLDKHKIVSADILDLVSSIRFSNRTSILCKSEGTIFSISDIVDFTSYGVYTTKKLDYPITFDRVQMFTGYKSDGRLIFYGDEFKGGIVIEHNGLPYVKCRELTLLEDIL